MRKDALYIIIALASIPLIVGCGKKSATNPGDTDRIVNGINVTQLFAPAGQSEVDEAFDQLSARKVTIGDVHLEASGDVMGDERELTVEIYSHTTNGVLHYGAVIAPTAAKAASLPVLIYTHEGNAGIDLDYLFQFFPFAFGSLRDEFVFVVPSYRSESIRFSDITYTSGGGPSPWDHDVDDVLGLLGVALQEVDAADPERIGIFGFSRGATVAMLAAERDPRIDLVIEYYGPTDFLGPFAEEVAIEALEGEPRDLPGVNELYDALIEPIAEGTLTIDQARAGLIARSPIHFAEHLPDLMLHHGTADNTVPVEEAERMIDVMTALGRGEPEFEYYLHAGAGHSPVGMLSSFTQSRAFLGRLLQPLIAHR